MGTFKAASSGRADSGRSSARVQASRVAVRGAVGVVLFGLAGFAVAGNTWLGTNSKDWSLAANWGGAFPTGTGSSAIVNLASGNFPLVSATPSWTTPWDIIVGTAATGQLDHTAGTLNTGSGNWMIVGQAASGNGIYNLANTAVVTAGTLSGFGVGTGSVNVGGTSTTGGRLILGDGGTSVGVVNMNTSGTLKTELDDFGMILGNGGTSTGTFNLEGGTVQINALATGAGVLLGTNGGDGTFKMSGGTVNMTGGMWVGDNNAGSQGVVQIAGGNFNTTAGNSYIGRNTGQGTVTLSSGSLSFSGITHVGYSNTATAGTAGTLTVSGGTFTNTGEVRVGSSESVNTVAAVGSGTFTVSGGTATIGALSAGRGNDNGDNVNGTVNVSAGTLTVNNGDVVLGYAGAANNGTLNISGTGTVNVGTAAAKLLALSFYDTSSGTLNVSGGNLNLNSGSSIKFTIGNTGTNTTNVITQSGGNVSFFSNNATTLGGAGVLDLKLSGASTASNTYNLNGGTLTVPTIVATLKDGTRVFNFNGGTLRPTAASTAFFAGGVASAANVRNGGAIIDTRGVDVTIGQQLIHSTVTNDAAIDGGLTKNGAGQLTLTGSNTFTGPTVINVGTLYANAANAANNRALSFTSGVTVNNGATLRTSSNALFGWDGTQEKPVTVNAGGTLTADSGSDTGVGTVTLAGGTLAGLGASTAYGTFRFDDAADKIVVTQDATVSALNVKFGNAAAAVDVAAGKTLGFTGTVTDVTAGGVSYFTKAGAGTVVLTGANAYTGATTINAGTVQIGNGGTTGTLGTAAVTNNGTLLVNRSDNLTLANAIGGTGGLTKVGANTLTLTGANTYGGTTNVNAGRLAFTTNAQNLAGGALNIADGAALSVRTAAANSTLLTTGSLSLGSAGATTLSIDFNGLNPTATQIATGALTLNGTIALNFAGTSGLATAAYKLIDYTTLVGGVPNFNATSFTFGHTSGTLVDNTTDTSIDLQVTADSLVWTGAGQQTWYTAPTGDNAAPNDWATKNGKSPTNFWVNDGVEFNDTYDVGAGDVAVANRTVTITGADVNPSGVVFNNAADDYTVDGNFGITGTGSLVKNGNGKVSLLTSNGYTGGTVLNAGTLAINNPNSLGAPSAALTLNAGTLETVASFASARNITLNSSASTVQTDGGTTYALGGVVSGTGTLNKTGGGTLALSGVNTYTGGTAVAAGTLQLGGSGTLGPVSSGLTVTGGVLDLNDTNQTVGALNGAGGTILNNGATLAKTLTVGNNNASGNYAGVLANNGNGGTGTLALAKSGTGTLVLSGANTYTGGTTLSGGILSVQSNGALGASGLVNQQAGGRNAGIQLQGGVTLPSAVTFLTTGDGVAGATVPYVFNNVSGNNTINGAITLTDGGGNSNIQSDSGALTLNGNVSIAGGKSSRGLVLQGASTDANNVAGVVSDLSTTSVASITKNGAGSWTVSGANTYTGVTAVNAGTLNLTGSITTGATTVSGGTLDVSGAINTANAANSGQINVGNMAAVTAILNVAGTVNANYTTALPSLQAGTAATATGVINVTGGALKTASELWLSTVTGATGTLNVSGGAVTTGSWLAVGRVGNNGNLNVSGGSVTVSDFNLTIGSLGGTGQATITGGTVSTTNTTAGRGSIFVGENGVGTLSISGTGALAVSGPSGLRIASNAGSTGTVNLGTGGLITARAVGTAGLSSTFNFDGGTLRVGGSPSATYMQGLTNANMRNGGLVLDTNGNDVAVAQPLLHSSNAVDNAVDGGLTKQGAGVLALGGTNTYTGKTDVNAGTLRANAARVGSGNAMSSSTGVGAVNVNNGGTLAGTGGTGDVVVKNGGTLTAGTGATAADSVGTLSTGNQTWNAGGTAAIKVASAGSLDLQAIDGVLDLANLSGVSGNQFILSLINKTGTTPLAQGSYKVATTTGGISNGSVITNGGTDISDLFVLNVDGVNVTSPDFFSVTAGLPGGGASDLYLSYNMAPAPEPTTALLVALAGLPLLGRRRRKDRAA